MDGSGVKKKVKGTIPGDKKPEDYYAQLRGSFPQKPFPQRNRSAVPTLKLAAQTKPGYGNHKREMPVGHSPLAHNSAADGSASEIIQLRKINGSSTETPSYQNLHRELLLSHKRGLLLEEKPELKRVLEQRRLELHKEEEMAQRRPSDLETELRKRQQKLQEYEQEEIRQRENQNKIPEFVRVRENLRRTQTFEQP